jgi:hypothetical protein
VVERGLRATLAAVDPCLAAAEAIEDASGALTPIDPR